MARPKPELRPCRVAFGSGPLAASELLSAVDHPEALRQIGTRQPSASLFPLQLRLPLQEWEKPIPCALRVTQSSRKCAIMPAPEAKSTNEDGCRLQSC
jgi:hypothetical protein